MNEGDTERGYKVAEMEEDAGSDYEVGYGKTPVHTRFKKGMSGNPRGRRKGSKNIRTVIAEELNRSVTYVENGRRKKTTKADLIVKQASNKAVKGDVRDLLQFVKVFGLDQPDGAEKDFAESVEDRDTRESFLRRIQRTKP